MGTGFYGNTWHFWKPIFEMMKGKTSKRETLSQVAITNLVKRGVKETLNQVDSQEFRAAINNVLPVGDAKDRPLVAAVPDQMLAFLQFKTDLDQQLLRGSVSKQEYAHKLNVRFKETMAELANTMNASDYKTLFGADPGAEVNLGIDPGKISDGLADMKLVD
jgi:N-methylhydantoinase B/oxoprolinase/acetone carboxylase alpha subunit